MQYNYFLLDKKKKKKGKLVELKFRHFIERWKSFGA